MPLYLLDTNIVSDLIRNPRGEAATRFIALDPADVCTSIVVASELSYGCRKKGSAQLSMRVEAALAGLEIKSLSVDAHVRYGALRTALEQRGTMIGANDLFIAAHALTLNAVLVTDDTAEFSRVDGLMVENWLR
jgi:tRNA(fMet)-specific endonuclease VapC